MPVKFGDDAEPVKVGDDGPVKLVGEAVTAKETKAGIEKISTEAVAVELEGGKVKEVSLEHETPGPTLSASTPQPKDGPHAAAGEMAPAQNVALVTYGLGFTKKTGEYENVRPFVQLTMPCPPTQTAVEATWEFVLGWVDTKASQIHEGIDASLKS